MDIRKCRRPAIPGSGAWLLLLAAGCALLPWIAAAQGLMGVLVGTVKDAQGGVLPGAVVRVSSPALIGGPAIVITNEKGQLRVPALLPGPYTLDIEMPGFATLHEEDMLIGAGATIERTAVLRLAGVAESVTVEGAGARIDARDPGFGTRFSAEEIRTIPTRRGGVFDFIRATPGFSPTSGTLSSAVSAFGSSTNENTFQIDGTNFTSPANGAARADPGLGFVQEVQIQSAGASAEYGNAQGAVVNIVTRQGGDRFLFDASYYGQSAGLTSQPVLLPVTGAAPLESGYERASYRELTTNLGGPIVRDHLWFFTGYQYLRDFDSQPGTDPRFPRASEQHRILAKLTWRLARGWRLVQSFHDEFWVNPEQPTLTRPFAATVRFHGAVPALTFGHLTHTSSANTVWELRVGRFRYSQEDDPSTDNLTTPSRFDRSTNDFSGAPPQIGHVKGVRTTAKSTFTYYRPGVLRADHLWKLGGEFEQGDHQSLRATPGGVRFIDNNGGPFQAAFSDPSNAGGLFRTVAAFGSDALTLGNRLTIDAGLRFDHSRAVSQDLPQLDANGRDSGEVVSGLGTLYTWNVWSPRLGMTAKLSANGRTVLRASYGRYRQGVLTGEISPLHPGVTAVTTYDFVPATGGYTLERSRVDRSNLHLDPNLRSPRTDEYSFGIDREVGRQLAVAAAYIHKGGAGFIGWTDDGGRYREEIRTLADGRQLPVSVLVNGSPMRRFILTNPEGYSLTYHGLVMIVEKRRSHGWQAFGSYTLSRAEGLQASSGTTAAGAQVSTVGSPPIFFGRDPNDLTNARGRLPNDRPHMLRAMGSVNLPRTGLVIAGNLQYFSGKPWAATALIPLSPPQAMQQRVLLEPRGSRRLSSQALLDVRLSRTIVLGGLGRIELMLDVLNALNDSAEEAVVTDDLFNSNFSQGSVFMDPRRVMISVRLNLGR